MLLFQFFRVKIETLLSTFSNIKYNTMCDCTCQTGNVCLSCKRTRIYPEEEKEDSSCVPYAQPVHPYDLDNILMSPIRYLRKLWNTPIGYFLPKLIRKLVFGSVTSIGLLFLYNVMGGSNDLIECHRRHSDSGCCYILHFTPLGFNIGYAFFATTIFTLVMK